MARHNDFEPLMAPAGPDEPLFHAPWEARAFAVALRLSQQACYSWDEFRNYLIAEIAADNPVPGVGAEGQSRYYEHWLRALEKLLADKGFVLPPELEARTRELAEVR